MSDGTQCFIKNTECFLSLYPNDPNVYVRPTIDQFIELIKRGMGDFCGEHIVGGYGDDNSAFIKECEVRGIKAGTRIWDLEWCELSEFYFVYSNESKQIDREGKEL